MTFGGSAVLLSHGQVAFFKFLSEEAAPPELERFFHEPAPGLMCLVAGDGEVPDQLPLQAYSDLDLGCHEIPPNLHTLYMQVYPTNRPAPSSGFRTALPSPPIPSRPPSHRSPCRPGPCAGRRRPRGPGCSLERA